MFADDIEGRTITDRATESGTSSPAESRQTEKGETESEEKPLGG